MRPGILDQTRAIIFDLDDTLIDTQTAEILAYASVVELLVNEFACEFEYAERCVACFRNRLSKSPWDPKHEVHPWTWRCNIWRFAITHILRRLDPQTAMLAAHRANEVYRDTRLSSLNVPAYCMRVLRTIQESGIKLGIVTNGNSIIQREKLVACGAYNVFLPEHVCVGGEELLAHRSEKPSEHVFDLICTKLGVSSMEAMFVGDNLHTDIVGAHHANMGKVVFISDRSCDGDETRNSLATHVFGSIVKFFEEVEKELR